ncbi:hypothetical protein V8C42DRAFT_358104 [Trichoderma barbatum]
MGKAARGLIVTHKFGIAIRAPLSKLHSSFTSKATQRAHRSIEPECFFVSALTVEHGTTGSDALPYYGLYTDIYVGLGRIVGILANATKEVLEIAEAVSHFQSVIVVVGSKRYKEAEAYFKDIVTPFNTKHHELNGTSLDVWARGFAPTFVVKESSGGSVSTVGLDWNFNGLGNKYLSPTMKEFAKAFLKGHKIERIETPIVTEDLETLSSTTNAKDHPFEIVETEEPGEDFLPPEGFGNDPPVRSNVNYLLVNGGITIPQFGDSVHNAAAIREFQMLFGEERKIHPVMIDELPRLGGGAHCATQEVPVDPSGQSIKNQVDYI